MIIENTTFDESEINYISLTDNVLSFVDINDVTTYIPFTSAHLLELALKDIYKTFHSKLAKIGGLDSAYMINCKNILSKSILADIITINFAEGDAVIITCVNSEEAINHKDYLDFKYLCNHLSDFLSGKTIRRINSSYVTSGLNYSNMFDAYNDANDGDVLLFEKHEINLTSERLNVNKNLTFVFEETEINVSEGIIGFEAVFRNLISDITLRIFGSVKITVNHNAGGWQFFQMNRDSRVYIEFDEFRSNSENIPPDSFAAFSSYAGKYVITGRKVSGVQLRLFDNDSGHTSGVKFDSDIMSVSSEQIVPLFFPSNAEQLDYYCRGGQYELTEVPFDTYSMFYLTELSNVNLILSFFKSPLAEEFITSQSTSLYLRFWSCQIQMSDTGGLVFSFYFPEIENYGQSYSTIESTTTEIGTPLIVDTSLELSELNTDIGNINTIQFDSQTKIITMYSVMNATSYNIYLDDEFIESVTLLKGEDLNYTLDINPAQSSLIRIQAINDITETSFAEYLWIITSETLTETIIENVPVENYVLYKNNIFGNLDFSIQEIRYYAEYLREYFYEIVTLEDWSNGNVYLIHVRNVKSYSIDNNILSIEFINGEIIYIYYLTNEKAIRRYNYLNFRYESVNIDSLIVNKRKIYVDNDFTNDTENLYFNNIQSAIDNSRHSDVIIINAGEYNEFIIDKDIWIYFKGESTVTNATDENDAVITMTDEATPKIFAKDTIINSAYADIHQGCISNYNNDSTLYIEAKELSSDFNRVISYGDGELYCKTLLIENTSAYSPFDWDSSADLLDIDCLEINSDADGFFMTFQTTIAEITVRNAFINSDGSSLTYGGGNQTIEMNLINARLKSGDTNISIFTEEQNINMWNSNLQGDTASIENSSGGITHLKCFNNIFANNSYDDSVIKTGDGNFSLNLNLDLTK